MQEALAGADSSTHCSSCLAISQWYRVIDATSSETLDVSSKRQPKLRQVMDVSQTHQNPDGISRLRKRGKLVDDATSRGGGRNRKSRGNMSLIGGLWRFEESQGSLFDLSRTADPPLPREV